MPRSGSLAAMGGKGKGGGSGSGGRYGGGSGGHHGGGGGGSGGRGRGSDRQGGGQNRGWSQQNRRAERSHWQEEAASAFREMRQYEYENDTLSSILVQTTRALGEESMAVQHYQRETVEA